MASPAAQQQPDVAPKTEEIQAADRADPSNDGNKLDRPEADPDAAASAPAGPLYSVLSPRQKRAAVMIVSFVAMISPLSGATYYPAITALATDFKVSITLIQLTITMYLIFQGIAPSFIGNFSDIYGRRPAYAICIALYLAATIGLALVTSFAGLMVLRCLQAAGSSATIALAAGSVADIVTRAERGKFIAYASIGVTLGPALGPVVGGLLTESLGWRAIFWFLTILSAALFAVYFVFVPETARSVVGDGSIPPPRLFMTPSQLLSRRRGGGYSPEVEAERAAAKAARARLNPFAALRILGEREGGVTLGFGSLMYAGQFMVLATLPVLLEARFGFNAAQVGLCYLPIFLGAVCSRWVAGRLLDWNFARHARRLGLEVSGDRQQGLDGFPIERARLEVCIPMIYATGVSLIAYGWTMQRGAGLAGIIAVLFFFGVFNAGGLAGLTTLVVDTHQESPATALAANNLFRCLVSAGATAAAVPLIDRIGIGWTAVFVAGVWVCFSPCLWLVLFRGEKWRRDRKTKSDSANREAGEAEKAVTRGVDAGEKA